MKMSEELREWHHRLSERDRMPPLIADVPWNTEFATWLTDASDDVLFEQANEDDTPAMRCMLYLWNGCLKDAHTIAQQLATPLGSYLHGIMHRREPDYWNAKHWFRKAGELPMFTELYEEFDSLRTAYLHDVPSTLKKLHAWNPLEFVDNCEKYEFDIATQKHKFLQRIQQIELQYVWDSMMKGETVSD